jgi:hypothetical protein
VPAGQGQRTPGGGHDPLDPFSFPGMPQLPRLPPMPPLFGDDDPLGGLPPYPEELRVDHAPDPYAFLRAVAVPNRVVVGQQVTLKIFAYGRQGPFREASTSEPSRPDFIAHTIVENSYGERSHRVPIDGHVWIAQKVRELALFPIRSGALLIGPMKMVFDGRGYPSVGGKGLPRESAPIEIVVTEPPLAGRPPGYRIGDVGQYSLTASVEPRELLVGEALSIVATLDGTGNVPFKLRVPQQHGLEWLDPTIVDDVEVRGSTVSGTRKLGYIVRAQRADTYDLGELSLPFWDPTRDAYRVARAALGTIVVRPNAGQSAETDTANGDRLHGLVAPRKSLGAPAEPRRPWSDSRWYWLLLLVGPFAVVLTGGAARALRQLRERALRSRSSAGSIASRELAGARRAADLREQASHVERALVAAIEAATGLRARGILRAELAHELVARGVAGDVADDIRALLDACDDVRFTGQADDAEAADLPTRAESAIKALAKRGASPTRSTPPARAAARGAALALVALLALTTTPVQAESQPEQVFASGVKALELGAWDDAIDQFELLADRGYSHPDASFNRAVAYVERARTPAARPGDLGRAAAALAETLELRPGDDEADAALDKLHGEIARQRARQSSEPISARPSLARAAVQLAPEQAWATGALIGSLALTIGLLLRFASHRRRRLAGAIMGSVGALWLVVAGCLTLAARHYRVTSQHAVVVAPDARLLDQRGAPIRGDAARGPTSIPEGSSLYVLERRGLLARVEWGTTRAWVDMSQLRILARP